MPVGPVDPKLGFGPRGGGADLRSGGVNVSSFESEESPKMQCKH